MFCANPSPGVRHLLGLATPAEASHIMLPDRVPPAKANPLLAFEISFYSDAISVYIHHTAGNAGLGRCEYNTRRLRHARLGVEKTAIHFISTDMRGHSKALLHLIQSRSLSRWLSQIETSHHGAPSALARRRIL